MQESVKAQAKADGRQVYQAAKPKPKRKPKAEKATDQEG